MDPLEQELKKALGAKDPPLGFEGRVMARIVNAQTGRRPAPRWRLAFAGGLAAVLVAGGVMYQHRQVRRRGEAARDQLLQALQITSVELNRVRQTVQERGRP